MMLTIIEKLLMKVEVILNLN